MNRWLTICLLLAAIAALALRAPSLGLRPLHNDEAVNGIKFGQLWTGHGYRYDPKEYHGPTLHYATYALAKVTGAPATDEFAETRLRSVTVVFGLGLLLLLALTVDGLGRRATAWAALFTAVSPALVFYSRYFIHETLLVFATFLAIGAGWRYWRSRKIGWALLAGLGLGLMHATKETFVLTLAAGTVALLLNQAWNRMLDASGLPVRATPLNWRHLAAGLAVWIFVAVLLFSSFFTNASGPFDSVRTYFPWLQRAGGDSPHIHPWTFYLERLLWFARPKAPVWTEVFIFALALIGGWAGFARKKLGRANASFVRFLTLYSFVLAAIYTLLAYKTTWCVLSFWQGMVLLAGVGAAFLIRSVKPRPVRWMTVGVLLLASGHLAWQSWRQATDFADDRRNPYVYAQTSADLLRLVDKIKNITGAGPAQTQTLIKVICPDSDYWPLPWYLRQFHNVGWWEALPQDPFAPLMVVSSKLDARLDEKKTHLMAGYFQLRPDVFLELYVELDLWRAYLAKNPPRPAAAD